MNPSHAPSSTDFDTRMMALALKWAERAIGLSDPNPRVGCVIVSASGHVIGQGHTQETGGPHAEVMALRDAAQQGHDVRGATAYVTLEPCAHHGRTPPCADALVNAGLARVVAAMEDPFEAVAGQGLARLRAAGLQTSVGLMADAARELNLGFLSRVTRRRPWVRLKIAASLDGRTALPNGVSQWITSPEARADGHAWRRRASAVLTGIGTVLADDPQLDVRLVDTARQPMRVVLDRQLRTPVSAKLLRAVAPVLIYTEAQSAEVEAWRHAQMTAQPAVSGMASVHVCTAPGGPGAPLDPAWVLADLAQRGVNELHVEAGATLNGALLQAGLVDECLLYLAPRLLGEGRGMAELGELTALDRTLSLDLVDVARIGPDLRVRARPLYNRDHGNIPDSRAGR